MQYSLLPYVESKRAGITACLDPDGKGLNGQFMTPALVAQAMADMFPLPADSVRLLDAGAGAGSLTSAFLDRVYGGRTQGLAVDVSAYETDPFLAAELRDVANTAIRQAGSAGNRLSITVREEDFIFAALALIRPPLTASGPKFSPFTHAILNPPYRKLSANSRHRIELERAGIKANNLYAAFVGLAIRLLAEGGHLVAITPRSFCNGPYFKPFRQLILSQCRFEQIHVFESRQSAFKEDDVLQENIIFHLRKVSASRPVVVSSSFGRRFDDTVRRTIPHDRVVNPADPDLIIHIPVNEFDEYVVERMAKFRYRLSTLALDVSTGPVVDFRLRQFIHDDFQDGMAPLLYPSHFSDKTILWPEANGRKPNAISRTRSTLRWLFPNGHYVLIRRFSAKEERRRIFPALFVALDARHEVIGFENHLNVIHSGRKGLDLQLARGLTAYFSSTIVDLFFRQFSGHTQVNAGDLRLLPLPDKASLLALASFHDGQSVNQQLVDRCLESIFTNDFGISSPDPVAIVRSGETPPLVSTSQ